jgi:transcriptional regulator with XRE-family HTH domain
METKEAPQNSPSPGAALRALRTMAGLTLKDVAENADTSIAYLSKVERDEFKPTRAYVGKVAAYIASSVLTNSSERAA